MIYHKITYYIRLEHNCINYNKHIKQLASLRNLNSCVFKLK